jgi:hypothetical protein
MKLLGIDPGKHIGWAVVSVSPEKKMVVHSLGVSEDLTLDELSDHIKDSDLLIIESFLVRPKEARKGAFDYDPMETPQVIGALKLLCHLYKKPFVEQNPSVKPVGYGFARQKYVAGKKGTHALDALAHAAYYAVKNLNSKPLGL